MPGKNELIRFFKGNLPLGMIIQNPEFTIVELANDLGIDIPTNCTSGTCGTCLVRLKKGIIEYPEDLPPGLDDFLVGEGGFLPCCMSPKGECEIDIIPPL